LLLLGACGSDDGSEPEPPAPRRANVLIILADDLGYSDIGAFGSEIATPHLDALAREGRLLSQFYTAPVCGPTRAELMSGADHHRVGLANNPEVLLSLVQNQAAPFGTIYTYGNMPPGYEGFLNDSALAMPELFRDAGYRTYMSGKWHLAFELVESSAGQLSPLQLRPASFPKARGFERSFALLNGGASHFAPRSARPTVYDTATYAEDDVTFPARDLPADFYSSTAYADKLIGFLDQDRGDPRPFLAYLAFTAPHFPLHAPAADLAAQAGNYDVGYEVIRERRVARLRELGVIAPNFAANPGIPSAAEGGSRDPRWHELTPDERAYQARLMEVYAAMVTRMDAEIGRVIQHLKDIGEYDHTLILFMSDNGPDDGGDPREGPSDDNALENLGHPGSTKAYGKRWAEVGATPLRRWKGRAGAEGANSVPAIVRLPGQAQGYPAIGAPMSAPGRPKRESSLGEGVAQRLEGSPMSVLDLLPTLLDFAGIPIPRDTYQGRPIIAIDGVSQWASLSDPAAVHLSNPPRRRLEGELAGITGYAREGSWKLSRVPEASNDGIDIGFDDIPWELFDLQNDRGETLDLATSHPDLVERLVRQWQDYVADTGVILRTGHSSDATP